MTWNAIAFLVFRAVWLGWNDLMAYPGEIIKQFGLCTPLLCPPLTSLCPGSREGPEHCPQALGFLWAPLHPALSPALGRQGKEESPSPHPPQWT